MHTVFALLCFVVVIHWLIFPYPSGLLHWHCGNLTIAPVPAKQPWWIWINTSCEFIMNDCITTAKQSTTKPCAYFLGYTVALMLGQGWILHHKRNIWKVSSYPDSNLRITKVLIIYAPGMWFIWPYRQCCIAYRDRWWMLPWQQHCKLWQLPVSSVIKPAIRCRSIPYRLKGTYAAHFIYVFARNISQFLRPHILHEIVRNLPSR